MICTIVANQGKWTTVLEGKLIGTSKHIDYSIFHAKAKDVAALKKPITKFIWVGADDKVIEVILTSAIQDRGQNFKTAKRDNTELTDVELAEISGAIELARAAPQPKQEPAKPRLDFNAGDPVPVDHKPTEETPKVMLSAAGAANGLGDVLGQAPDEPEGEPEQGPEQDSVGQATEDVATDPLAAVKPSRAYNRRKRR